MVVNHEKAIAHMNKQLKEFGVVSFAEVNKASGGNVLNLECWLDNIGRTAKAAKRKSDLVLVGLPFGAFPRRKGSAGKMGSKSVHHLIEERLEPFFTSLFSKDTRNGVPTLATILFKIDNQDVDKGQVVLESSLSGTRQLVSLGALEKSRFSRNTRPKNLNASCLLYNITDVDLMKRVITSVKRVITLQKERWR